MKKLLASLIAGLLMLCFCGMVNASSIVSTVGDAISDGGTSALSNNGTINYSYYGYRVTDLDFSFVYDATAFSASDIISASISIDLIDADVNGSLELYENSISGSFIGSATGSNNGTPGVWRNLGVSGNDDNLFFLDLSTFNSSLASGTFNIFGDNDGMTAWGSNRAELVIEYNETSPVPIPAAVWLLGSGLLGLVSFRRKRKTA